MRGKRPRAQQVQKMLTGIARVGLLLHELLTGPNPRCIPHPQLVPALSQQLAQTTVPETSLRSPRRFPSATLSRSS